MSIHVIGLDVSAVAKECRLGTFALMAVGIQGPVRIEYAATHPDVVTELVLCNGVAKVESSYLEPSAPRPDGNSESRNELGGEPSVTIWEMVVPGDELTEWANLIQQARS